MRISAGSQTECAGVGLWAGRWVDERIGRRDGGSGD
jgi:hypothetical protein